MIGNGNGKDSLGLGHCIRERKLYNSFLAIADSPLHRLGVSHLYVVEFPFSNFRSVEHHCCNLHRIHLHLRPLATISCEDNDVGLIQTNAGHRVAPPNKINWVSREHIVCNRDVETNWLLAQTMSYRIVSFDSRLKTRHNNASILRWMKIENNNNFVINLFRFQLIEHTFRLRARHSSNSTSAPLKRTK